MAHNADSPFEILVMPGESIGPETITQAVGILELVIRAANLNANIRELVVGEPAYEATGEYLPAEARKLIEERADSPRAAILFGTCADEPIGILRKDYDLFANLRPIRPFPALLEVSPLKPNVARDVDMMIVRELVSDVYYGRASQGVDAGDRWAAQEMVYRYSEVQRLVKVAFEWAARRHNKLTLVHKRNVIKGVFALWSDAVGEQHAHFPNVEVEDMHVDNMAMQMMLRPSSFDVIVSTNLFGDILSEIGAGVLGSLGLVPSVSLNSFGFGLYEPAGGTAPDIAGNNIANPIAAILSVAMMCEHMFRAPALADAVYRAVGRVVTSHRTRDIADSSCTTVTTSTMGTLIRDALDRILSSEAKVFRAL